MVKGIIKVLVEHARTKDDWTTVEALERFYRWWSIGEPEVGSGADFHDWEQAAKPHKIRWFLTQTMPMFIARKIVFPIKDAYWWVLHRFHPKHRYHVIKPDTLKPGYHDTSEQMLHSVMFLITSFRDFQLSPASHVDWDGTEDHKKAFDKINQVADWWKEYPNRLRQIEAEHEYPEAPEGWEWWNLFDPNYETHPYAVECRKIGKRYNKEIAKLNREKIKMLKLAAEVSPYLWD